MLEDPDVAQARELLQTLDIEVAKISQRLEAVENRSRQAHGHTAEIIRRQASSLRRELHEAHRLIDRLHYRFPQTRPARRSGR